MKISYIEMTYRTDKLPIMGYFQLKYKICCMKYNQEFIYGRLHYRQDMRSARQILIPGM